MSESSSSEPDSDKISPDLLSNIYIEYKEDIRQHNLLFWRIPAVVVLFIQGIILFVYRFPVQDNDILLLVRFFILLIGTGLALVLAQGLTQHIEERSKRQPIVKTIEKHFHKDDGMEKEKLQANDPVHKVSKVEFTIFSLLVLISFFSFSLATFSVRKYIEITKVVEMSDFSIASFAFLVYSLAVLYVSRNMFTIIRNTAEDD